MPAIRLDNEELIALSIVSSIGTTLLAGEIEDDDETSGVMRVTVTGELANYFRHQLGMMSSAVYALSNPDQDMGEITDEQLNINFEATLKTATAVNQTLLKFAARLFGADPNLNKGESNGAH